MTRYDMSMIGKSVRFVMRDGITVSGEVVQVNLGNVIDVVVKQADESFFHCLFDRVSQLPVSSPDL
jgi:hypothetical protein